MQRRKFIAGVGSLAAAGAAGIGTGAFSSVRADRSLDVSVAGDQSAYLSLDATVSEYAEETDNTVEFQFDGSGGAEGSGLNDNADTFFTDVLRVENQGTDRVRLQVGGSGIGVLPDGPLVVSFTDDSNDGKAPYQTTPFASSPVPTWWDTTGDVNNQDIGVGDDLYVHFGFYLNENTDSLGEDASKSVSDVPDQINFYADDTSVGDSSDFS